MSFFSARGKCRWLDEMFARRERLRHGGSLSRRERARERKRERERARERERETVCV